MTQINYSFFHFLLFVVAEIVLDYFLASHQTKLQNVTYDGNFLQKTFDITWVCRQIWPFDVRAVFLFRLLLASDAVPRRWAPVAISGCGNVPTRFPSATKKHAHTKSASTHRSIRLDWSGTDIAQTGQPISQRTSTSWTHADLEWPLTDNQRLCIIN